MPTQPGKESVSAPTAATDLTREELPYRLRQQSLLGEFGRSAMQTRDIGQILQRATELCSQGLETSLAKVLEYMPDDGRLLVRAGVGWAPGTIGQVSLGIDMESPAGYAFQTGQMVIKSSSRRDTLSHAQAAVGSRDQAGDQCPDRERRGGKRAVRRSRGRQCRPRPVRCCGC